MRAALTGRYCDTRRVTTSTDAAGIGPWPDPDADPDPLEARHDAGPPALPSADGGGSRGAAIAVAGMSFSVMLVFPVLIVIGVYTFITVYAIAKAVSGGSDAADPATVLVGIVGLVTVFSLLLGLGGWLIGRGLDPAKHRSR